MEENLDIFETKDITFVLEKLNEIEPFVKMQEIGEVFLVGGIVRDHFLNKESKDVDLLICGIAVEKIKTMLEGHGTIDEVGESFGVIKFKPNNWCFEEPIDIAIPRTEKKIGDGHKGFEVRASSNIPLEVDLMRRDFTINAMVMGLDGKVIDPFNGMDDINNRVIRMVNPEAFKDDPLRMMRAIQFASRFEFTIDIDTWESILDNSKSITEISGERILTELDKIFEKGEMMLGLDLFFNSTLHFRLFKTLPNSNTFRTDINTRADFFSMFLKDDVQFTEILKGDTKTAKLIKAIKFMQDGVSEMMQFVGTGINVEFIIRKLLVDAFKTSNQIFESSELQSLAGQFMLPFKMGKLPIVTKQLEIDGNDIMDLGFKGPEIGRIFDSVMDEILANRLINEKEQIINFIKKENNVD